MRKKHKTSEEEKLREVPKGLEDLIHLSIFDGDKFEKIEKVEYEVVVIGDIDLTKNDRSVLILHTKFSLIQPLPKDALDLEKELYFAKLN